MKSRTILCGTLLAISAFLAGSLGAAVVVTEPTGGQNISADKALTSTNGAGFTALGSIVLTEGSATDFTPGNNQTLILNVPSGWRFNAGVGSVSFSGSRDITAASISVTASNLTVTYSVSGTAKSDVLTISGLQVQPLDGANAPVAGYIQRVGYNPGNGVINGIVNDVNTFGLCNILAGAARALAIQTDPAPEALAGELFGPQPEVRVLDQFGNLRELDTTTVVTASRLAGTGTLQGSLTQVAIVGIGTYTNISHNVAGTISILFTSPGLTSVTSAPVVITPALADHLAFSTQPGSASVGSPFGIQPMVTTQDRFGNLSATSLGATQLVSLSLASGTGPLLGTTLLNIGTNGGNGIVAFSDLEIDAAGTNKQLKAASAGMTNGLSSAFAVSSAAFSKLQILVPGETAAPGTLSGKTGTPAAQAAGTPFIVTVNAVDAGWNLVNTISDAVAISSTDGAAGLPVPAALVSGTKTFSVTLNTVGTSTVTSSDLTQPSKTANTSPAITVGGGTPAKLAIQTQPSATATAGVQFAQQAVVRVEDAAGNLVAVDSGRVITVARGTGTSTLQGTLTATTVNGLATFSASGLTPATSSNVVVSPAAVSKLAFATQPGGASHTGAPLAVQPVIKSQDQFGNFSSVGLPSTLPVSISLTGGSGSLLGTAVYDIGSAGGNGTITGGNLECSAPGASKQLTASATGLTLATSATFVVGGMIAASGGTAISADTTGGTFSTLSGPSYFEGGTGEAGSGTIILNSPSGFVFDTGGTAPTVIVTRLGGAAANSANINGVVSGSSVAVTSRTTNQIVFTVNTASSSDVTCSLTWTNVRVRPLAGAPLASGNITKTGTSTVFGLVNSVTSLGSLTEVPGLASRLAFVTQPAAGIAGQPFGQQPVLKSRDQFGNDSVAGIPASKILAVALTSGTGPLLGATNIDFGTNAGNGTAAFTNLEIDAALTTKQLTASSAGFTNAISSVFTVASGPASRLTISTQPSASAIAGTAFAQQPVIRVEDQFGNLRNADNSTVVTASRNAGTGTLQGTVSVTAAGGVVTFNNLSHQVANTITIDFTNSSLASATSSSVAVAPASASRLTIQTQPSAIAVAGQPFPQQPIVRVEDAFGNVRSNDNATVVTASRNAGSGVLQGTTNMTAVGGVVVFTNLTHSVVTNITIQFASGSLTGAVSTPVAINPGPASRIVFATQPASATAGAAFGVQPALKTQDALGNDSVVGLPGDLNLVLTLTSGSGPLQGATSLNIGTNARNGIASFSGLRIDAAGTNKQLTATVTGMTALTSTLFTVTAAAGDHLTLQSQPSTSGTAGVILAQQPVLRLEDAFGNLLISDNASLVTAGIATGSGALQGTVTRAALGGVVSFTNLSYNVAETITLSFGSGGLNSVVSSNVIISAAAANRLTIQTQPSASASAGVAFAAQPVVRVEDQFGNRQSTSRR